MEHEQVAVTGIAAGGDGVGRLADGRAVFVRGAVPGDTVRVEVEEEKPRFARGRVVEVVTAGPGRVEPPCAQVALGCGGCGWQHVDPATQRDLKVRIVLDALTRTARLDPAEVPEIDPGPDLPATGYRTTVRAAVGPGPDGRAGFRAHHAHDVVALDPAVGCAVAHPLVDEVLRYGRFAGCDEVTVRAGAATGERLVVADPGWGAIEGVPDDVRLVGTSELAVGTRAWIHEEVGGRRFRVSAESFFQARPDGAAALVAAAAAALAGATGDGVRHLVDLYAGVGLFAGLVHDALGPFPVTAVESSASSIADAKVNLADLAGLRVVRSDVRRWHPARADAVIADPSRHGLGAPVVERIAATGAGAVVLVSCDPGALGRDAGLLRGAGYRLGGVAMVDLFPNTPHVEVLTTWLDATKNPHPGRTGAP